MDKARAVAAVVRLLDLGFVRVGSECYVTANKSYGATTLRKRHADVDGRVLNIEYKAKSGKMRQPAIADGSLIRFVRNCDDLPGQHRSAEHTAALQTLRRSYYTTFCMNNKHNTSHEERNIQH